METFEFLQYMIEQEHEALEKLMNRIETDEQLKAPMIAGRDEVSIGERLAHVVEAEYRMATYLYQTEADDSDFEVDPNSIVDIQDKSQLSKQRHLLTLDNLDKEDLAKVWTSKVSGNEYDYKFLIWHFIEHLATHRGQVAMALNSIEN